MKNVYKNTNFLDKRACEKFKLTSELLMENAAFALETLIAKVTHKGSVITILCGGGDNGGDGYVLARRLSGDYHIRIYQVKEPKSPLCQESYERANECEIKWIKKLLPCDVIVDCIFGSGFKGELETYIKDLLLQANKVARIRIACDIPSGLSMESHTDSVIFKAHYTMCMGALKLVCLNDVAKDYVGELLVGNLGLSAKNYEISSNIRLLESHDLCLPLRLKHNVHKGSFGHLAVFSGEKIGASIITAQSALHFGAGLVSLINDEENFKYSIPFSLMSASALPHNTSAIAAGMGLGKNNAKKVLNQIEKKQIPCVLDADIFHTPCIKDFLDSTLNAQTLEDTMQIVLTPHPKEFASLLEICELGHLTSQNRFEQMLAFSQKYPHIVLVLKGANVWISKSQEIFINPLGSMALAKGGSGDVLAGLIGALLAQGYSALSAAIQGSLAHSLASRLATENIANYALTPQLLIENITKLHKKEFL